MALIKCPECERSISDKANSCPQCGYQLKGDILETTTVELTSKKLKLRQAIGYGIMLLSFPFMFNQEFQVAFILLGIGFVWVAVVGIQIWWNHK